jgi:hypothetical protein
MALVYLKNAGITDPTRIDQSRTVVTRLASEPLLNGVFRQVHRVVFHENSGIEFQVITVNKVSEQECSEGSVTAFLVSKVLGESSRD